MKVIEVHGGGFDNLKITERPDPVPGPGEIVVAWHATSLNYHDFLVAAGAIPVSPGRIPMSDGAGEVVEVGAGVTEWKPGDKVMSLFFPNWIDGKATPAKTRLISGESIDGYIAEKSRISAQWVTAIP
ncbi:MAG: NAD(P)-dependent alcohol dehydrogenase, partial [Bacteroidetes bacterium]